MEGIKRLSEMIKDQKDKALIKVVSYLMLQTDMDLEFLKEEKNLKDMAEYIKKLAKKEAINGVAIIEDEVVYQWAKDYFSKSNEELGITSNKTVEKKIVNNKNKVEDNVFGSIFGTDNIVASDKKEIEQISLFAA